VNSVKEPCPETTEQRNSRVSNPLSALYRKWQDRKQRRAAAVLEALKVQYHTFRVLLANNEYSLDLLRTVDRALLSRNASWTDLSEEIDELMNVTYELVDGLNRLSAGAYKSLYAKHGMLESAIRSELDRLIADSSNRPSCIFFDDLTTERHKGLAGGKAVSLAFLRRAGLPVPNGFAVSAKACEEIISAAGLDEFIRRRMRRAETGNLSIPEIEDTAAEIGDRIRASEFPREFEKELLASYSRLSNNGAKAISVRSSALLEDRAEHSFAGHFKSLLNVTSFEGLVEAVKEVVAGGYSARTILYRLHAGLPLTERDFAFFCQEMVPARAAGVLFTVDPGNPENGRMLVSAVPGLGVLAVNGSAPTDLYRPSRKCDRCESFMETAQIASKTIRAVGMESGGIVELPVPDAERSEPVLSEDELVTLVRLGRMIEDLFGKAQDIEWAISTNGEVQILQSRQVRFSAGRRHAAQAGSGNVILKGGVCASPGRSIGRVRILRSAEDLRKVRGENHSEPRIVVLRQSLVDAAALIPALEGVIVDLGNPADHLSCIAREYSLPMITGTGKATRTLRDGQWIILDADRASILEAPEDIWSKGPFAGREPILQDRDKTRSEQEPKIPPESVRLHGLIEPLSLTDSYGPTFSIMECESLHDIIRFTHEMAVLSMFRLGDSILEEAGMLVHVLHEGSPLHFLIIDLGGGLTPGSRGVKINREDLVSAPLLALIDGIRTEGLRWNEPPPASNVSGLLSRSLLDGSGARPVGQQNYALISRDYLNLNARVDYHFAMLDSVCGMSARENYIRFRFKGGGTAQVQRERRARFIAEVLRGYDFFTDQRGDLVTGAILEMEKEEIEARLVMLGRLMGFSRLLDASMQDDSMPGKIALAFRNGDFGLKDFKKKLAEPGFDQA
jgi:pyruvate, water dikinase